MKAFVTGVGMTPFGRFPATSAIAHGVDAVTLALADAGIGYHDVQALYCGATGVGWNPAGRLAQALGINPDLEVVSIDSASASGSAAFRRAVLDVASGERDVVVAAGIGKLDRTHSSAFAADDARWAVFTASLSPAALFAMRARRRMELCGTAPSTFHQIAVKSHRHASLHPYAQFRRTVTLEEVASSKLVADPIRLLECCPTGDGGAAAVVMSEARAAGSPRGAVVQVIASAATSTPVTDDPFVEFDMSAHCARRAYEQAGVGPDDLDLCQVHDAFSVEEIEYYEALGICPVGDGDKLVMEGDVELGGRIPFNTDGGLLSRGHPLGPTGLAQIWETVVQLRNEAGARQVDGARVGLAQMVGAGGVCVTHILQRG